MKKKKRVSKCLSFLLAAAMSVTAFGGMPSVVKAEDIKTADVYVSAQQEGVFLAAPQVLSVKSDLAESYGYTDAVAQTDAVSALDVLVAENILVFGGEEPETITKENIGDYLKVSESGLVTKMFSENTSAVGFAVNEKAPYDANSTYDPSYGYTGYMINQAKVQDNDKVEFFFYQDSMYLDKYATFKGGSTQSVLQGKTFDVYLSGYYYMSYGCLTDETIASQTNPIEYAQLATVDTETGVITPIDGKITDETGKTPLAFNEPGDYLVTAYMPTEDIGDGEIPIIMPLMTVTVESRANADNVIAKISAIGTVSYTTDSKALIDDARKAYNELTELEKTGVTNYTTLTDAEAAYKALDDPAKAQIVIGMINGMPEVVEHTADCKAKLDAAYSAYYALTADQKSLVTNAEALLAAGKKYKSNMSVETYVTAQADGSFIIAPQNITVNANLAETYHFADQVGTEVSALDVLVGETIQIYGEENVTPDTIDEYLQTMPSYYGGLMVSKLFKQETSVNGFVVNGVTPSVTVAEQAVYDDDVIEYYIYQDKLGYSDSYTYFDSFHKGVKRGTPVEVILTGSGYDANWNLVYTPVADALIAVVDAEGVTTPISGIKTDSNGKASVTFDKTGTYILTATSATKTIIQPVMVVEVGVNPELDAQEANIKFFNASTASVSAASYTYTGAAQTPAVTVKNGSTTLAAGTDYTVEYKNNTNVGTATATITGIGKYAGADVKTLNFNITAKAIKSTKISSIKDQTYTGKSLTPAITVKDGSKKLVKNTDYKVSYKSNKKIGTATVTITGIGNYTGTKTATFKIVPKKTTISKTSAKKTQVTLRWKKVSSATGYKVYRSTSKNGKYTVVKTIKNNKTVTYTNKKLKSNKKYYYKVVAYKTVSKKNYISTSAVKMVKTKK